jgi:hypothetical protein
VRPTARGGSCLEAQIRAAILAILRCQSSLARLTLTPATSLTTHFWMKGATVGSRVASTLQPELRRSKAAAALSSSEGAAGTGTRWGIPEAGKGPSARRASLLLALLSLTARGCRKR